MLDAGRLLSDSAPDLEHGSEARRLVLLTLRRPSAASRREGHPGESRPAPATRGR